MRAIVVMGASGLGTEAIWVLEEMNSVTSSQDAWDILGYADDDPSKNGQLLYQHRVLGTPEEVARDYAGQELWYYCAIGKNAVRAQIASRLDGLGWKAATLIHPSVIIARNVAIGCGTYVGAGSILCPNAFIGSHVLINVRVAIGHDAVIEDFSQISPGAQITGFCKVGREASVGSNASIFPGKSVGARATVGSNSHVIRSVKPGTTVSGVPALKI